MHFSAVFGASNMGFSAGTVATVPDGGATVASAVSIMGNVTPTGGLRCGHGYNTTPKTTIQRLFRQQLDPSFSFFLCLVLFFFLSPPLRFSFYACFHRRRRQCAGSWSAPCTLLRASVISVLLCPIIPKLGKWGFRPYGFPKSFWDPVKQRRLQYGWMQNGRFEGEEDTSYDSPIV